MKYLKLFEGVDYDNEDWEEEDELSLHGTVKEKFSQVIGEDVVDYLCKNNWVKFDTKPYGIYKTNEIEMNFLERDGKGDTVIFFGICYNEDNNKLLSKNCVDRHPEFDTYEELKKHMKEIEDRIINNGFNVVYLP